MPAPQNPPQPARSSAASVAKWLFACLLLAIVVLVSDRTTERTDRFVMISTDDAGMCTEVNRGTIAALQNGIVRSTSIMTCCPGFDEFAEFARAHPEYDYGVHLTLTCDLREAGWGPVSNPADVPSLVAADGFLHSSTSAVAREADISEVERELRAQIRKALDRGLRITHLDHHMWVLFARPDLLELYDRLGQEFGLPIRLSRKPPGRQLRSHGDAVETTYARLVQSLDTARRPVLDAIEADNYSIAPREKRPYFLARLRELPPGVTEFVIHCASPHESGIKPPDAEARYADTSTFSAAELRAELDRLRITSLSWTEFLARTR